MKKRKGLIILIVLGIICCIMPLLFGKLFGSSMDWLNQHITFADYFRNLFYQTGKLIPNMAWNIGLGQNIYNFSYYGFLNPIILISYLLPFISMSNYIMLSSVILYLLSIYLFYKWVSNKFDNKLSFLLTFIFMCSAPLYFHFHRHIMFVNYFPFLLLSLIEIDKNRKYSLCLLSIFITLMIFTSYYYSVGGILCIILYYIYVHYNDKLIKKIGVLIPIIIGILLSGVLIIPTLYTILSGRNDISSSVDFLSLIIPDFKIGNVIYGSYTLGVTSIIIPSLIGLFISKNKSNKLLSFILLILIIFPMFRYLLNGGLYIRSKSLIPFLPLYILSIGIFFKELEKKEIDYSLVIKISLVIGLLSLLTGYFNILYYLDLVLIIVAIRILFKNKKNVLYGLLILEVLVMFVKFNLDEDYVDVDDYNQLHKYDQYLENIVTKDNNFYRVANNTNSINYVNFIPSNKYNTASIYSSTYNSNYYNFYHNILNTNNDTYNHLLLVNNDDLIMNRLFGVKYILSNNDLGTGYKKIEQYNGAYLYENLYALPLGYASSKIYDKAYFNNLTYPYNLEALLTGIIVENSNMFLVNNTIELNNDFDIKLGNNISASNNEDYTILEVTEDSNINLSLKQQVVGKLLFIEIDGLESNHCDTEISMEINNVRNRLTCTEWQYPNKNNTFHFLIDKDKVDSISINISKGTYKITNVHMYTMDNNVLKNKFDLMNNISINNNILTGNINTSDSGYMVLSIPYDKGFNVKIDGNSTQYEMVNNGFIGFKINSGYHKIELSYESPYYQIGLLSSIAGLVTLLGILVYLKFTNKVDN